MQGKGTIFSFSLSCSYYSGLPQWLVFSRCFNVIGSIPVWARSYPTKYLLIYFSVCTCLVYLLKVSDGNTRAMLEIFSKVNNEDTRTTSMTCSDVSSGNFEQISHIVLVLPLLTLNIVNARQVGIKTGTYLFSYPGGIYLFEVNNRNTRARCEICPKVDHSWP